MSPAPDEIAIVGGGICGLSLALSKKSGDRGSHCALLAERAHQAARCAPAARRHREIRSR